MQVGAENYLMKVPPRGSAGA